MALHNDIFKSQIWDFFVNDLDSSLNASKISQFFPGNNLFPGGLNFAAALVIFTIIDFVSSFYAGSEANNDEISEFISKYLGKYVNQLNNKKTAKKWYKVFRNGLSHQWSPKGGGVAMSFWDKRILTFQNNGSEDVPILNVPPLYLNLKSAIKDFEQDLDLLPEVKRKFDKRYKEIVDKDFVEMRSLRELWLSYSQEEKK